MKRENVEEPKMYLGTNIKVVYSASGNKCRSILPDKYVETAI